VRWLPATIRSGWKRALAVVMTVLALALVFRRVDTAALGRVLREMHVGWFALAVVTYGLACLCAAWRWHLMLRLTHSVVHPGATARVFFIGHFFNLALFGPAFGDLAKSALYSRWYRTPLPELIAASPLDRMLGLAGLFLAGLLGLALAVAQNSLPDEEALGVRLSGPWLLTAAVMGAVVFFGVLVFIRRRPPPRSALGRVMRAFADGVFKLLTAPVLAAKGLGLGTLTQLFLCACLGCGLLSAHAAEFSWARMFWTLPVISMLAAMPSVAGLGVREGAALALFGLYGIPEEKAVAASLLMLGANLVWGFVGAGLLWREEKRFRQRAETASPTDTPLSISVVIPTLNESAELPETIRQARAVPEVAEIIVVDGGSRDGTADLAAKLGCRVLATAPGRGGQLRAGAEVATGEVILLLHADTWLLPDAGRAITACQRDGNVVGGGFWKVFRNGSPLLLGSRLKCALRLFFCRRVAGDQALFVRRSALVAAGGVPAVPLMEEFILCAKLNRLGRLALAESTVVTSARRFARLGVLRTYGRMWWVAIRYRCGTTPQRLREIYER
jgi:rSAM/selenodomain-associated transferase 2